MSVSHTLSVTTFWSRERKKEGGYELTCEEQASYEWKKPPKEPEHWRNKNIENESFFLSFSFSLFKHSVQGGCCT